MSSTKNGAFTSQDLYTFLIGLAVGPITVLAEGLVRSQDLFDDPEKWAIGIASGSLAATGRYVLTVLTQRGLVGKRASGVTTG